MAKCLVELVQVVQPAVLAAVGDGAAEVAGREETVVGDAAGVPPGPQAARVATRTKAAATVVNGRCIGLLCRG
jgi:hypothetical protein